MSQEGRKKTKKETTIKKPLRGNAKTETLEKK